MYPGYNMNRNFGNIRPRNRRNNFSNDRFFGGGFFAPLLLGGIAGYALGNQPNSFGFYQQPFYPNYYNNFYYNTYPYYY